MFHPITSKVPIQELTYQELDYWVARAIGIVPSPTFRPSADTAQCFKLINDLNIKCVPWANGHSYYRYKGSNISPRAEWVLTIYGVGGKQDACKHTELQIGVCTVVVLSKLGRYLNRLENEEIR